MYFTLKKENKQKLLGIECYLGQSNGAGKISLTRELSGKLLRGETNQVGNMIQKQAVLVIKLLSLSSKSNSYTLLCDAGAGSLNNGFLLCQLASY